MRSVEGLGLVSDNGAGVEGRQLRSDDDDVHLKERL
jgi:hypothetical protein